MGQQVCGVFLAPLGDQFRIGLVLSDFFVRLWIGVGGQYLICLFIGQTVNRFALADTAGIKANEIVFAKHCW